MRSQACDLAEQYGYPDELTDILEEVVEIALEHLGDVVSIVLSPSTSTGDFLWNRVDSNVQLMSDVDGFIYVDGKIGDPSSYDSAIRRLTKDVGGPMFHIDLAVNPARALNHLPNTFQFAETGLAGFILYGEPVLDQFPTEFDPRSSRQAFLLNLFKPFRHSFLAPNQNGVAQAMARLILDIPILAASEQGKCIAGHRARARWFLDEAPPPFGHDQAIRTAVIAARDARESPPGSVGILEPLLHEAIPRAMKLLDGLGEFPADPDLASVERLASWLPPRSPRRFVGECRALLQRRSTPSADLRWLLNRKEASAGAALLGLFLYLESGATGPPPAGIRARLSEFSRRECSDRDGLAFIRFACEIYSEGLFDLYPSLRESD